MCDAEKGSRYRAFCVCRGGGGGGGGGRGGGGGGGVTRTFSACAFFLFFWASFLRCHRSLNKRIQQLPKSDSRLESPILPPSQRNWTVGGRHKIRCVPPFAAGSFSHKGAFPPLPAGMRTQTGRTKARLEPARDREASAYVAEKRAPISCCRRPLVHYLFYLEIRRPCRPSCYSLTRT